MRSRGRAWCAALLAILASITRSDSRMQRLADASEEFTPAILVPATVTDIEVLVILDVGGGRSALSNGLPYVFDRFVLDGQGPPLDELLSIDPVQTPVPIDRSDAGRHRDELPLGRDLVTLANVRS